MTWRFGAINFQDYQIKRLKIDVDRRSGLLVGADEEEEEESKRRSRKGKERDE